MLNPRPGRAPPAGKEGQKTRRGARSRKEREGLETGKSEAEGRGHPEVKGRGPRRRAGAWEGQACAGEWEPGVGRGLGEGDTRQGRGGGRAEEESPPHRLSPPRTPPQEGAREAGLCPALQMKSFIYMASLQPGPAGRGQLQGTGEEAQRKQSTGGGES